MKMPAANNVHKGELEIWQSGSGSVQQDQRDSGINT